MQKNKKFKRLIFVVLSSIFIMISGISYVSGQTTSVATPTQTATSTTTPSTTTPTVTPGGTTTETPSITPPTTSTTEPGESSTETATPVPTPSVTCSVSTMPSLSSESCSHSGSIQYKPCGDCSTNSRTCCEQMKWSDWGAPCPDYEEPHVCVGMKSWSENLGRCACAEEPGFYASSGPTTTTVSNNKKLNDNCVWVCDRTDCPTGFQFNTETCKCDRIRYSWSSKEYRSVEISVTYTCHYNNKASPGMTFGCSNPTGSSGPSVYGNYNPYSSYKKCDTNYYYDQNCTLGSYCMTGGCPEEQNSSGGDVPTTTPGGSSSGSVGYGYASVCGVTLTCDDFVRDCQGSFFSGYTIGDGKKFNVEYTLMECVADSFSASDSIFPWETPQAIPVVRY